MKLTESKIKGMTFNGKPEEHRDDTTPGLSLRVGRSAKSYICTGRIPHGKVVRTTLGRHPTMRLSDARKAAAATLGQIKSGISPVAERRTAAREEAETAALAITLREAFDEYVRLNPLRDSTVAEYTNALETICDGWMDRPILEISVLEIRERHATYASKARSNGAMKVLRAVLTHVITTREIDKVNAVTRALSSGKRWHKIPRRRTWIEPDQMRAWLDAVDALPTHRTHANGHYEVAADLFRLLMFTGLRSLSEAASLTWADVNLKARTITLRETKTRTAGVDASLTIPLNSAALEVLQRRDTERKRGDRWVFPGEKGQHIARLRKYIDYVRKDSGTMWTPHDCRRTFLTNGEALGTTDRTLKRLVGHSSQEADVTSGYISVDLVAMREASQRIADRMLRQGGRADDAKVVAIAG